MKPFHERLMGLTTGAIAFAIGFSTAGAIGGLITLAVAFSVMAVWDYGLPFVVQPWRTRSWLRRMLDPDTAPPADTVAGRLQLAEAYVDAADRATLVGLLADDFVLLDPRTDRRVERNAYLRRTRRLARVYRGGHVALDEVRLHPDDPTLAWVRLSKVMRPWIGPSSAYTYWEAWTCTPDQTALRSTRLLAVTHLE
jgi:hypothetical protein